MLKIRTPARGLSPQHFYELIGKNSNRDIKKGDYIQEDDLNMILGMKVRKPDLSDMLQVQSKSTWNFIFLIAI